ncbi:MAG: hypothetical protein JEZ09_01005 [Salinivirgaceae bacterium]|nr:hypothetical protein [Salinivirgaceae bacterium]
MQEILEQIKESFNDEILSRSEKRNLKEIISSNKLSKSDLDWLRNGVFLFAREKSTSVEGEKIINWLEKANKLLLPKIDDHPEKRVFFSPGDECLLAIIDHLNKAVSNIDICVFTISDNRLSDKIIEAHRRGVRIRIITDDDKSNDRGSDIHKMAELGIDIKMDNSSYHMHHKFAIFDKVDVITGSFNWTRSAAEYNQENILVSSDKHVISAYVNKFESLWQLMKIY